MSDKLTEALRQLALASTDVPLMGFEIVVAGAARRWASFPTDADVEAAARALEQQTGLGDSAP